MQVSHALRALPCGAAVRRCRMRNCRMDKATEIHARWRFCSSQRFLPRIRFFLQALRDSRGFPASLSAKGSARHRIIAGRRLTQLRSVLSPYTAAAEHKRGIKRPLSPPGLRYSQAIHKASLRRVITQPEENRVSGLCSFYSTQPHTRLTDLHYTAGRGALCRR